MAGGATIAEFRAGLDPDTLATVDALRAIIAQAAPDLDEAIKWNAPSFHRDGEHRVTLGLERDGGVRIVLHRGAKVQDSTDFAFADPFDLASWPAPDRGVILIPDAIDAERFRPALMDIVSRWVAATG